MPGKANVCMERTGGMRRCGGRGVGSGQESSPLQGRGLGEGACASPSLLRLAGKPASLRISPLKGRENKPQWLLSVETGRPAFHRVTANIGQSNLSTPPRSKRDHGGGFSFDRVGGSLYDDAMTDRPPPPLLDPRSDKRRLGKKCVRT